MTKWFRHPLALLIPVMVAVAIVAPNLPGSEQRYTTRVPDAGGPLAWFPGLPFNQTVAGDWTFYDIAILPSALRISLKRAKSKVWVYFLPAANPRRLAASCTDQFCSFAPFAPDDADFRDAVQRLNAALDQAVKNNGPLFEQSTGATNLPAPWYELGFLTFLVMGFWIGVQGVRQAWQQGDWFPVAALCTGGLALLMRLMGTVAGPLHANHHGAEELDFLLAPAHGAWPSYYGRSHQAMADLVFSVLPRSFDSYMLFSALVGAGACLFAASLVAELTSRRWAGIVAGVALALHPLAMRGAMSESPFHFGACFTLAALWGLVRFRRGGHWGHLLLGHSALMLAIASHVLTLPFAVLPFLVLVVPREGAARRLGLQLAAALASAILAVPHAVYQFSTNTARAAEVLDAVKLWNAFTGYGNLLIDPGESPWVVPVLGLCALLLLRRGSWRLALFAGVLGTLCIPFFLLHSAFTDMVRYQIIPATLLAVIAGLGFFALCQSLPKRIPEVILAVVASLLLMANTLVLDSHITAHDASSREYRVLADWVADLPQSGMMVVPPAFDAELRIAAHFPELLLQDTARAYTVVTVPVFQQIVADGGWPDEPVFYFEGVQLPWIATVATLSDEGTQERAARLFSLCAERREMAAADPQSATVSVPIIAPGYPTEFIALPGNEATFRLFRLLPENTSLPTPR
jgi:hypothetical protein